MTDRDRLIELLHKAEDICDSTLDCDSCKYVLSGSCKTALIADYLLANGVIVPPCKVGDKLYQIVDMSHTACKSFVSDFSITVLPYQIYYINVMGGISAIPFENFGKTVFLTKEEAEEKLKELNNNA